MRRILKKCRVPAIAADRAIAKTLQAAFDFQLADLRYGCLKTMEAHSYAALDHLIRGLRDLSDAIARLSPTSKGQLNKRVFAKINQAPFDSEVFIEIIDTIEQALPEIGPRRLANNVLSVIHPELGADRRAPIIDSWEATPAVMRVKVETMVQDNPSRSLVSWLDNVLRVLERERPARKRGAPHSLSAGDRRQPRTGAAIRERYYTAYSESDRRGNEVVAGEPDWNRSGSAVGQR